MNAGQLLHVSNYIGTALQNVLVDRPSRLYRFRLWLSRWIAPKGTVFNADMSLELDRVREQNQRLLKIIRDLLTPEEPR